MKLILCTVDYKESHLWNSSMGQAWVKILDWMFSAWSLDKSQRQIDITRQAEISRLESATTEAGGSERIELNRLLKCLMTRLLREIINSSQYERLGATP